jgi:hypothetical protein
MAGRGRQLVEERPHEVAAPVAEPRDLAGLDHRVVGRMLHGLIVTRLLRIPTGRQHVGNERRGRRA